MMATGWNRQTMAGRTGMTNPGFQTMAAVEGAYPGGQVVAPGWPGTVVTEDLYNKPQSPDDEARRSVWWTCSLTLMTTLLGLLLLVLLLVTSDVWLEELAGRGPNTKDIWPGIDTGPATTRRTKEARRCSPVKTYLYYCDKGKEGYYFHYWKNKCVSTSDDEHFLCACNGNRFPDSGQCTTSCANKTHGLCHYRMYFAPCKDGDIRLEWWFLNTRRTSCRKWTFLGGYCPTNPGGHEQYHTYADCAKHCLNNPNPPPGCLHERRGGACSLEDMNTPHFTYIHSDGSSRCHSVAWEEVKNHRCVDEDKRFETMEECNRACRGSILPKRPKMKPPPRGPPGVECPTLEQEICVTPNLRQHIKEPYPPGCPLPPS